METASCAEGGLEPEDGHEPENSHEHGNGDENGMSGWLAIWENLLWADGRATAYALVGIAGLTVLEFWIPAEPGQGLRGRGRNLVYLALYKVLGLASVAAWYAFGPVLEFPSRHPEGFERVLLVVANLACIDFLYYWYHRAQHRFSFLWAIHELHHADAELNATSSYRTYWLEAPVQTVFVMTPTLLLFGGAGPGHALAVLAASLFFLIVAHANLRIPLGALGIGLVGPQVHRIHHSRLPAHRDRNFAQVFPVFDWLFGTYHAPARDEFPPTGAEDLASDASIGRALWRPFEIWTSALRRS